ncbi:hypothetical protein EXS73_03200 [Candidatus Pacearchaeota archaeon]|nr:hypothetical protein [Candidatus Pacearchaeota archaeon]
MGMKITVKARFNTSHEKLEAFGNNMYLAYLMLPEDAESGKVLAMLLSKKMGVPPTRVEFAGKDVRGYFVFEYL